MIPILIAAACIASLDSGDICVKGGTGGWTLTYSTAKHSSGTITNLLAENCAGAASTIQELGGTAKCDEPGFIGPRYGLPCTLEMKGSQTAVHDCYAKEYLTMGDLAALLDRSVHWKIYIGLGDRRE